MEKLDGQRKHYQDWSAVNSELERLMRFVAAFSYQTARAKVEYADEGKAALERKVEAHRAKHESNMLRIIIRSLPDDAVLVELVLF